MRVCVMPSMFPVTSQTFVMQHVTGLLDNDIDVNVLAHRGVDTAWESLGSYQEPLKSRVWYYQAPSKKINRIQGILSQTMYHLTHGNPDYLRSWNILHFGKSSINLNLPYIYNKALDIQPVDILHCHFGHNGVFGAYLKKLGFAKKLVVTFHGHDVSVALQANASKNIYKSVFEEADLILPVSEFWKNRLIDIGAPESRVFVHRVGIDIYRFSYRERGASSKPFRIITTARLVEKKGISYALEAVAKVKNNYPEINFYYDIIGEGPLLEKIEDLVTSLEIADCVKLHGALPHGEVQKLLAEADVFILPSIKANNGDQEGIPVSLMEAMASGMPVLSTLHSGIPELVEDGVSGYLVPERDINALAEKIVCLAEQPESWKKLGEAGRAKVEQDYNKDHQNIRLIDMYRKLIG
ncbi:colanic acid biosynthesis glycosyltransferase WcaL [Vreelandella sulfidaeris]|uniref:Colanic acid biosynthesis glycosyltransferase WcaL n=2 Tax=Vreelandella sulfidaeris TaxID=115553 RepID=A0A365TJU7_9GAMM|nr:colanic acid biosynthesis glycosyltransferase WcaL [Halomonas sulfidaeris]